MCQKHSLCPRLITVNKARLILGTENMNFSPYRRKGNYEYMNTDRKERLRKIDIHRQTKGFHIPGRHTFGISPHTKVSVHTLSSTHVEGWVCGETRCVENLCLSVYLSLSASAIWSYSGSYNRGEGNQCQVVVHRVVQQCSRGRHQPPRPATPSPETGNSINPFLITLRTPMTSWGVRPEGHTQPFSITGHGATHHPYS